MKRINNMVFLYSGLSFLFIALLLRWMGVSSIGFWTLFIIAIVLKSLFLVNVFRMKGFRPGIWLYLILTGVVMILASMLFKAVFPIPLVRNILFYGAIVLKATGLILLILQKKR